MTDTVRVRLNGRFCVNRRPTHHIFHYFQNVPALREGSVKADFQSVEFSERAEIPLFTRENVALKLNR